MRFIILSCIQLVSEARCMYMHTHLLLRAYLNWCENQFEQPATEPRQFLNLLLALTGTLEVQNCPCSRVLKQLAPLLQCC
jgi:hypothetical protein